MSKLTVLVTGGTGFLGSHVISQLLEQGYFVRAVVRPGKSPKLLSMFPDAGANLQTIEVESLTSDYSRAVKGVGAVIHCANPTYSKGESGQEILEGSYYGTFNIVNSAIAAGVKKIVITSSIVSLWDPDFKAAYGDKILDSRSYGSVPLEGINPHKDELYTIYQTAKTLGDKKALEIARGHTDVDLTVIVPPAIFGPFVPRYPLGSTRSSLSTVDVVFTLVAGEGGPNTYPTVPIGHMIDVRDAARAHILALDAPPLEDGREKRLIICSKIFTWKEAAAVIRARRPEVASRLPGLETESPPQSKAPVDTTFSAAVLGLKEYIPWEETILASLDDALKWEKENGIQD